MIHSLDFEVRDYECDMQGIVNNSVYQNYLEHTRHSFLKSRDLEFSQLVEEGVNLVVIRAELDYVRSLRSGDTFRVEITDITRPSPMRVCLHQQVVITTGEKESVALKAVFTVTSVLDSGRPKFPKSILEKLFR